MSNPFHSPEEVLRRAAPHVELAARQINDALAKGDRVFQVPKGLGTTLQDLLTQAGWSVALDTNPNDENGQTSRLSVSAPNEAAP